MFLDETHLCTWLLKDGIRIKFNPMSWMNDHHSHSTDKLFSVFTSAPFTVTLNNPLSCGLWKKVKYVNGNSSTGEGIKACKIGHIGTLSGCRAAVLCIWPPLVWFSMMWGQIGSVALVYLCTTWERAMWCTVACLEGIRTTLTCAFLAHKILSLSLSLQ